MAAVAVGAATLAACSQSSRPTAVSGNRTVECTAPGSPRNPRVADPSAPHGLFVLGPFPGGNEAGGFPRALLGNPDLCGTDIFVSWSQVDSGPAASPRYNWSSVEQALAPWEAAGKTVNLIVWGASEGGTAQRSTPAWVQDQVQMIACGGRTAPTPVFWQSGYEDAWQSFVSATVTHFNSDPHIGYVRFGLGIGGEGLLSGAVKKPECAAQWDAAGYPTQFAAYTRQTISFEGSLHSRHQLMVALNTFDDIPAGAETAEQAAAAGIGFGFEGLQSVDVSDISSGDRCAADWCALFDQYAGRVPLHVQTLAPSDPGSGSAPRTPESQRTGPLPALLRAALSVHAQIFELYPQDWEVAFDPSDPDYAQYHVQYARALASAAAVVGVAPPHR